MAEASKKAPDGLAVLSILAEVIPFNITKKNIVSSFCKNIDVVIHRWDRVTANLLCPSPTKSAK
jgi:hypothetical protein